MSEGGKTMQQPWILFRYGRPRIPALPADSNKINATVQLTDWRPDQTVVVVVVMAVVQRKLLIEMSNF